MGRKTMAGLCALCLLSFGIAAQGALAANGTTAFTCSSSASTKTFTDSHCVTGGGSSFGHVAFSGLTELTASGGTTKLHSVISGVEVELQSTEVTGFGTMENAVAETAEHTSSGTGVLEYKKVTVTKPAGKGCTVTGGEVKTKELKATTAGQAMGVKFEPASGSLFAEFSVTGCSIAPLNGSYEVKGSVVGTPEGATTVTTRAGTTAQATLKLRGQNAGIDGKLELTGRANTTESFTPLGATTVETAALPPKGTTALQCKSQSGNAHAIGYADEHCTQAATGVAALSQLFEFAAGTPTEVRAGTTQLVLEGSVEGTALQLTTNNVELSGTVENHVDASGEHYVEGTGSLVFKEVKVHKPGGEDEECDVRTDEGGIEGALETIDSEPLKITTTGQGDAVKIEAATPSVLARFFLKCPVGSPVPKTAQGTWTVSGSLLAQARGATLEFSHAGITTANTLSIGGAKAGLFGKITTEARDVTAGTGWQSLAAKTKETP